MPITVILSLLLATTSFFTHTLTLIFDAAGDAKNPGRVIGSEPATQLFERTATLSFARHIKEHIATLDKKALVLFSRLPGELKDPLEKIRFVQQCNPDMFIHFAVYQSSHIKPQIHFYYNAHNTLHIQSNNILMPISQAHTPYIPRSKELLETIYASLHIGTQRICDLHNPISIPCSPLTGIAAPACIIEIGVQDVHHLEHCITPLAESLLKACTGRRS